MARAETDLIMICASDIAGQLRGKAAPLGSFDKRRKTGVGWTPTNALITSFGPIAPSPWGAMGDLMIRPDEETRVDLDLPDLGVDENFVLGDILSLDGAPWECCLRGQLSAAIRRLESEHGLRLSASFEHEFRYFGAEAQPGLGYTLRAYRRLGAFPNRLMRVMAAAGLELDTFMPEYGPGQCETTIGPRPALRAADDAAILRELVRATARGMGTRASFAPMMDAEGVGNGVHVHFSLWDEAGRPASHDPERPHGMSARAGAFLAGVQKRMPEFMAMTASGVPSYLRLTPHRWSAAFTNLGAQDREASLRICPVFGEGEAAGEVDPRYHFEFRAADATASPHLALAAIINAGLDGLETDLPAPEVSEGDLADATEEDLARMGCERLPQSLDAALTRMTASEWAKRAFGPTLIDVIDRHKRCEIELMAELSPQAQCERYAQAY